MKVFEQLLDLVTTFTLKRAFSLVAVATILLGCAWTIDSYSGYTALYRFEKSVSLLERIDALERKGQASVELTEVRQALLAQLHSLSIKAATKEESKPTRGAWLEQTVPKMLWGAFPWFVISLFSLSAIFKKEKNAWAGFFALQLFTILFAFINLAIPDFGSFWIDRVVVPWGLFFVCAIIPMSIAAIAAFKKVRESSLQKAILNNLRQIAAAADQFSLENGRDPESIEELIGPDKFIKALITVDGERYDILDLRQGLPLLVIRKSGEVVRYDR